MTRLIEMLSAYYTPKSEALKETPKPVLSGRVLAKEVLKGVLLSIAFFVYFWLVAAL